MAKKPKVAFESNPFKVIFNGFDKLFKFNQNMAIILLVIAVISSFGQFLNFGFGGAGSSESMPVETASSPELATGVIVAIVMIVVSLVLVILAVALFIGTIVNGFMAYVAYKTARAETTTFSEAIKAVWEKFWTILWIQIIVFFKVVGGLLLFIVPGVRAMLRYDMVLFPVFDGNANAKQAIAKSKSITKNHLIEVFGMAVAAGIIPFIGQLFHISGRAIMYPQLRDLHASGTAAPKVHWLNYLGFVLAIVLLLLIAAIVSIIVMMTDPELTKIQ